MAQLVKAKREKNIPVLIETLCTSIKNQFTEKTNHPLQNETNEHKKDSSEAFKIFVTSYENA